MKTIEQRVADTILQHKVRVILAGREYKVEQPTMATLIEMSAHISRLPKFSEHTTIIDMLSRCGELEPVADILATMIVGAKGIKRKGEFWKFWKRNRFKKVRSTIMNDCTPQELNRTLEMLLDTMQLKSFFAISVSLVGLNVTKPTETETTVSGQ